MIVQKYFEDLEQLHVNTMPNRAYYIPASRRMDDLVENRAASDRFFLLSGDWKFRYFDSVYDVKEEFFAEGYDTSAFETIPVPSVWQNYGHDRHQCCKKPRYCFQGGFQRRLYSRQGRRGNEP